MAVCQPLYKNVIHDIVELIGSPCYKSAPLPRIPITRKLGTISRIAQRSTLMTSKSNSQLETVSPRRSVTQRVTRQLPVPVKQYIIHFS